MPKDEWRYFSERGYTKIWRFNEDEIRAMEACTIKVYTGQQARYIWYSWDDKYEMEKLAREGYLPAMIAMVEQFEKTPTWYHDAALMGSTYAQNKIGWQNGGLGFEITSLNSSKFMVWSVRKGIPVKRGLIVKSINGIEFKDTENRSIEELSKFIGTFSPGTSVIVEFTNGKKVSVMTQRIKK